MDVRADTLSNHILVSQKSVAVVILHNHPSTQTFSIQDIRFFIEFSALEVMAVVSNQGAVHYLRREESYDLKKAVALFNECVEDLKKDSPLTEVYLDEKELLSLWIEYFVNDERRTNGIGTFKTLDESNEAMHIMADLLADFIIEEYAYVNANLDDFTWEGADVHPIDDDGKRISWGWSCGSMESALKKKAELLKKYPQVVVRDNATRKEKIYAREST